MPNNITKRNLTREERAAARNATQNRLNVNPSEQVGSGTTLSQGSNTPAQPTPAQPTPAQPTPVQPSLVDESQAYEEIRQMIQQELPEAYGVMKQEGPIALSELVKVAKTLLEEIAKRALEEELFLLMASTGLKRSVIAARKYTATCTGRVIIHGADGKPNEGVCLRPCCVGVNILHTLRQLGESDWRSGVDFLYTHLQAAFGDFPVTGKDSDGIKQCRIPTGGKALLFHKPLFPLVGVDLPSCPRMSEVLSDGTECVTRAGHTLVIPVAVSQKPTTPVPDPVAAGAAISGNVTIGDKPTKKAGRKKSVARPRTAREMERMEALESAAAEKQNAATELQTLKIMALADDTIIVQFATMIMKLANARVHPEAQANLLVTVVGSRAQFLCAEAPRHADGATKWTALMKQASDDGVDLNVFPGASGTCRTTYDECDRIVVTDLAMVRNLHRMENTNLHRMENTKLDPTSLLRNLMITNEDVIKPGKYDLQILMLDYVPNSTENFSNVVGVAWDTEFYVHTPFAPAPKKPGQREFKHFEARTMVRYCEHVEECSHDPRLGRITLFSGMTGNMGIAPRSGKTILGRRCLIIWCPFCSGIKTVGRRVHAVCCCGGSKKEAGKKRPPPSDDDKIRQLEERSKKLRETLEFKNAGVAWKKQNGGVQQQTANSEVSTPGHTSRNGDYYTGSPFSDEHELDNKDDEVEEIDETDKEDEADDEDDGSDGDPGPANKYRNP